MKVGETAILIGKRVSVGAAIGGIAAVFGSLFPDYAPAILSGVVPVTFITQLLIARFGSITT